MAVSPFLLRDADSGDDIRNVMIKNYRALLGASWGTNPLSVTASFGDSPSLDAFSRLRVSSPVTTFDSTFQYDLQPLIYEPIIIGTGVISHEPLNSAAKLAVTGAGSGLASLQSFRYIRYQPGKSQAVFLTFVMGPVVAAATSSIGLGDGLNGFRLQRAGSAVSFERDSTSGEGAFSVPQASWNLDKLDGTGGSGYTLDLTKAQILVFDMQWLGAGRVRCGFDIDGVVVYAHEFRHANVVSNVYTTSLNLPVKATVTTSIAVAASMKFICASVQSEGGAESEIGYNFGQEGTVTAASGVRTHLLSVQPAATFNSITNRSTFVLESVDLVVTGNFPIEWELCLGVALSGTTTFLPANATYSASEYNILGTAGAPAIVIASGYISSSGSVKGTSTSTLSRKYPITLDAAGVARVLGRVTLLATGLGGNSACRGTINWREIR